MPNFGFTNAQIDDIVAYLRGLDGGTSGNAPVVTFEPQTPTTEATISVRFGGTPPRTVSAFPEMQMGNSTMHTQATVLQASPQDPHVFTGRVNFSMGGPWIVHVEYDGQTIDVPLNVGS